MLFTKKELLDKAREINQLHEELKQKKEMMDELLKKVESIPDDDETVLIKMPFSITPVRKIREMSSKTGKGLPSDIVRILDVSDRPLALYEIIGQLNMDDYPGVKDKKVLQQRTTTALSLLYKNKRVEKVPRRDGTTRSLWTVKK